VHTKFVEQEMLGSHNSSPPTSSSPASGA
jgi:hypothetical protein